MGMGKEQYLNFFGVQVNIYMGSEHYPHACIMGNQVLPEPFPVHIHCTLYNVKTSQAAQ